jgi:hypothetical protein
MFCFMEITREPLHLKTDNRSVGQIIPRPSRNPKVHYRPQKSPPIGTILGQLIPIHIRLL